MGSIFPVFFNVIDLLFVIYLIGELIAAIVERTRNRSSNKKFAALFNNIPIVYSTIKIYAEYVLLETTSNHKMKLSIKWIKQILVKDSDIYDASSESGRVKVYEFHHAFGHKPLLSHDINSRDEFEKMIREKGISIN